MHHDMFQGVFPGDVDATRSSFRIHSRFNEPYIHLEIVKLTAPGESKAETGVLNVNVVHFVSVRPKTLFLYGIF